MDAADSLADTLAVFDRADSPSTPYTTSEVADELDCSRRTAYNRLERLAESGDLETKKVGARGRVWWRPPDPTDGGSDDAAEDDASVDDATRLREQVRRLERQREDLRRELDELFERIDDAFLALDDDLRVTYVNERAESLLDVAATDLLGRPIHDELEPGVHSERLFQEALETQESATFEEFHEPLDRWFEAHVYPSDTGLSVYFRDVTERKERERELERYETVVETLWDGVYALDEDERFVMANRRFLDMTGYDREELLGRPIHLVHGESVNEVAAESSSTVATSDPEGATLEFDLRRKDGETIPVESRFGPYGPDDRYAWTGVTRDVSDRKRFEETLKSLHDSSRELLGAKSREEVGEIAANAATDVLDLPGVIVYRHDAADGRLRPAERSVEADFMRDEFPDVSADDSTITGSAFVGGDPVHHDDVLDAPNLGVDPDGTRMRAGSFVPMGDHGVLVVGSREPGEFDHRTRQLVELLAANAEAAYDRVARETQLVRHREQLTALNNLNAVVRDINEALVQQSTREQVEQVVCDRLADAESYEFAWFGTVDTQSETVELTAEAGVENYLDGVEISIDPDDATARGPTGRAVRTEEMQVTGDVFEDPDYESWRDHARVHGFRSSAAIPVTYEDTLYGVLNVYADRVGAFEGDERRVVRQLGEVVGHAIASIERKRALMSDEMVELEFRIRDVFESVGLPESEGTISFDRAVPVGDDVFIEYGTATNDAIETLTALPEQLPYWEEVTPVREQFGTTTFEARLTEPPVVSMVASAGGYIESASIEGGDYHMTLHFPPTVDVRSVVERVRDAYPTVEVVTRRQVSRTSESLRRLDEVLTDEMTDRQRTALETAYFAGFFEWPRESSAQDVAESLGVADATFHQHVRLAENKLLGALFEQPATSIR
ncbi:GAF domain-containing protein [Halorussus limi]|uniref:GAF domain-containing protein n=1 Tax=Halorussus limi TaxID=2938695 RepID=A0A8U0HRD7_9EURY|nr:bacterio-opsin activator domain-containing protein [Halorussus limi]UPV73439.1 GAF domain-containing protein [Halorussus limi]